MSYRRLHGYPETRSGRCRTWVALQRTQTSLLSLDDALRTIRRTLTSDKRPLLSMVCALPVIRTQSRAGLNGTCNLPQADLSVPMAITVASGTGLAELKGKPVTSDSRTRSLFDRSSTRSRYGIGNVLLFGCLLEPAATHPRGPSCSCSLAGRDCFHQQRKGLFEALHALICTFEVP